MRLKFFSVFRPWTQTKFFALLVILVVFGVLYCFQTATVLAIEKYFKGNWKKSPLNVNGMLMDDGVPTQSDSPKDLIGVMRNANYVNNRVLSLQETEKLQAGVYKVDRNTTVSPTNTTVSPTNTTVSPKNTTLLQTRSDNAMFDEDVSLTTCVFPHIDPFDKNIMKMAGLHYTKLECRTDMVDLVFLKDNSLVINTTLAREKYGNASVLCKYRNITRRDNNDSLIKYSNFSTPFNDSLQLSTEAEFIVVECKGELNSYASWDKSSAFRKSSSSRKSPETLLVKYFALIPKHKQLINLERVLLNKRKGETSPKETMNVLMIALDGVSRYQFLRAMNKTYGLLMKDFNSFDMSMFNQVGSNTFTNLLALLNNKPEDELNAWWDPTQYSDGFDLIWKDFQNAGYRTLFTEDFPSVGGFYYSKAGFLSPPTVHHSHPIALAIERDKRMFTHGKHCVGSQPEINFHFDYIKRLFETFPGKPLYAMTMFTKITHDDMTYIKTVDEHFFDFYHYLSTSGILNNTLLITFSDHGPRWGPIRSTFNGIFESKAPFTILTLPPWFLEKYPEAARNLKINCGRLTTHFDTHATLQDILYFHSSGDIPLRKPKHGISLFKEIPKNRSCNDVPIAQEFCLCGQKGVSSIGVNSEISKLLAETVVASINKKRELDICEELELDTILDVFHIDFPENIRKEKRQNSMFKVRIRTKPGQGIYEATVSAVILDLGHSVLNSIVRWLGLERSMVSQIKVGHFIDRMSKYEGQGDCIRDPRKKPFCYCKKMHT
ncbi:hypothetical protein BgiBS90_010630 [Biomphalaria glabrata]|nr:hypothetical protein BgiBS90_010630 [Biomphalaria glabrata]